MKVLVKGCKQHGWSQEQRCNPERGGCGSILLVEEADIKCWHQCDYLGDCDVVCSFECGFCGVKNYITVPYDLREAKAGPRPTR